MRKLFILSALTLTLASAGAAFASSDEARTNAPRDQWMSVAQITEKFTSQGYKVRQVKVEKGKYEIYAIDKDGKRVEFHMDPVTAEIKTDED